MEINNHILNKQPLFFLFTCVKDGRDFINRLFDSLLSQTCTNFIHYIYEDGSDEPLDDLVEAYKEKVSKLSNPYKVIYEKNSKNIGLNMSTKHCIKQCCLPYFIWIDCDNWVNHNFFEEMTKTIKNNPDAIVIRSNCIEINEFGKESFPFSNKQISKGLTKKDQSKIFFIGNYGFSFFAVNFEKYKEINPTLFMVNERYFYNDNQVLAHCVFSGYPFCFSEKSISFYLRRSDSESHSSVFNSEIEKHYFIFGCYRLLAKNDNSLYEELLPIICESYTLFRQMILCLENNDFENAKIFLTKKHLFDKNSKLPNKFKYPYGSVLTWSILCKYPIFRSLVRKIRKLFRRI